MQTQVSENTVNPCINSVYSFGMFYSSLLINTSSLCTKMEAVLFATQRQAQSHDKILSDQPRRTNAKSYLAIRRIHIQGSNGFFLAPR